jgi:hypothetical protein
MKPLTICIDIEGWDKEKQITFLNMLWAEGANAMAWEDSFRSSNKYKALLKELYDAWFNTDAIDMGDSYKIPHDQWDKLNKLFAASCEEP